MGIIIHIVVMCPAHDCDKFRKLQEEHEKTLAEVAFLKNRIAWFERQTFGQKTERFICDDSQLQLDLGQQAQENCAESMQDISFSRRAPKTNKTPHGRDEINKHHLPGHYFSSSNKNFRYFNTLLGDFGYSGSVPKYSMWQAIYNVF